MSDPAVPEGPEEEVPDERLFSVEEASALLVDLIPHLEALRDAQVEMDALEDEVMASVPTNGGGEVHRAYLDASQRAEAALTAVTREGAIVRDPSTGTIDFASERDGEIVYLCWRLGEERIGWWHPPEAGFAGRQPL